MAFYCFYFIFYQKMQPWWSYVHKKYYQKRRYNGGWRLRWKITGERPEATRWCCLHIKGCPDMFWHSPGSPQPHLRILKWRGGTSWHRSPGCQTCFGFLLPWALNIQHIPTQTQCTRSAALHCIPGNNTTPTFLFPQHSLPDNTTRTIFHPGLFQHCLAFPEMTCRPRLDSLRKGTEWKGGIEQYGVFPTDMNNRPKKDYTTITLLEVPCKSMNMVIIQCQIRLQHLLW